MQVTDDELVERAVQGGISTFEELVQRHVGEETSHLPGSGVTSS
jgi:hypothetical protein